MAHLHLSLFDNVNGSSPLTLDDQVQSDIDLNDQNFDLNFADKAAQANIEPGDEYRRGDHVRLYDRVDGESDTIAIDPDVNQVVDLNKVLFNDRSFADRAARVEFVHNNSSTGNFKLRVRLYDQGVGDDDRKNYPTLIFYDWEAAKIDLSKYNFRD